MVTCLSASPLSVNFILIIFMYVYILSSFYCVRFPIYLSLWPFILHAFLYFLSHSLFPSLSPLDPPILEPHLSFYKHKVLKARIVRKSGQYSWYFSFTTWHIKLWESFSFKRCPFSFSMFRSGDKVYSSHRILPFIADTFSLSLLSLSFFLC